MKETLKQQKERYQKSIEPYGRYEEPYFESMTGTCSMYEGHSIDLNFIEDYPLVFSDICKGQCTYARMLIMNLNLKGKKKILKNLLNTGWKLIVKYKGNNGLVHTFMMPLTRVYK